MKTIYTKFVLDIATSEVVISEYFKYSGPVAECMSSGGGSAKVPPPTQQELELQELQLASLRKEEQQSQLMEPLIYEQMGYRKILDPKLNEQIVALQRQKNSLKRDSSADNSEAIYNIQKQIEGLKGQITEKDYILEKLPEEEDEITQLLEERQLAALKGTLPVSPALESNLEAQRTSLEESLSQRLGADYGHSTAGIQSLAEFDKQAEIVREEARRGQIATGENLIATRLGTQANIDQGVLQNYVSFGEAPASQSYLSAMQPFQEQRQAKFQAKTFNAAQRAQTRSGNLQAGVSVGATVAVIAIAI